jgi:hypothetical protein
MELLPETDEQRPPVWTLIRDIAVLQVKLIVDGLRDVILVPASLIAGVVSLSKFFNDTATTEIYTLVSVGKQSERWINLFGAIRNAPPEVVEENRFGTADIDDIVSRVETFVVDEYKRGGVTAQARDRMNEAMEKMRRRGPKPPP